MARTNSYNSIIAARTRAAQQILASKELLAVYEEHGGLADDLRKIARAGLEAEALSQTRSGLQAASGAATLTTLATFADVQKEYSAIMGVVLAVRSDLEDGGAPATLLKAVDQILVNEAEVVVKVTEKDGAKKRKVERSRGLEPLRAEIQKDATALVDLKGAHAALAKRKVDLKRMKALRDGAEKLAGHLAEGTAQRGAKKQATTTLHDAVADQKKRWTACYRILRAAGRADERIRSLLQAAAR